MQKEVDTIEDLQDLLGQAVCSLKALDVRDVHWARAMVSAVKAGGQLIKLQQAERSPVPKRPASAI